MGQQTKNDTKGAAPPYSAFLVRCWFRDEKWRFTIETIGPTRQKKQFVTLEDLFEYVQVLLYAIDQFTPGQE